MENKDFSQYLRSLVVGVETKIPIANGNHVTAINFDNAATTPPFLSVMNGIINFAPWYSSIHRGKGYKSRLSSNIYEEGRQIIGDFVKADLSKDTVIFTKSTTESINILAYRLALKEKGKVVISTDMEHLANDLPWRNKFDVKYVAVDSAGKLSMSDLERQLKKEKGKVSLVTVTGASNITGYINPIYEIAKLAHQYGTKIMVDAAQLAPHVPIDMRPHGSLEHLDYIAFSAHKMYAPFGVGVLVGPKETFKEGEPVYKGGGDVLLVSHRFIEWDDPPSKDEAGTPNIMGVTALIEAVKTINMVGMNKIHEYEKKLIYYAISQLKKIPDVELYGYDGNDTKRVGLISFNIRDISHSFLAEILSREEGISIRDGLFCAHPYAAKLLDLSDDDLDYFHIHQDQPVPGMVRISFGLYNNYKEIDRFIGVIQRIVQNKKYYKTQYKSLLM